MQTDKVIIKEKLQQSLQKAMLHQNEFFKQFYQNMFTLYPETKELFSDDIEAQRRKIFLALNTIIGLIDQPHILNDFLVELGRIHNQKEVMAKHYPMMRESLLTTFADSLGDDWTPELAQIWYDTLNHFSKGMLSSK